MLNRKPFGYGHGLGAVGGLRRLTSYGVNMGKGLEEPCSPYRQAYFFGAELNTPNASNWNCPPEVVDPTREFDLSQLKPYHEVVVGVLYLSDLWNAMAVNGRWYYDKTNKLLYEFSHQIPDPKNYGWDYWEWYYVCTYIGYVPWEIWENGAYHLDFNAGGHLERLNFTVTGIEAAGPSEITVSLEPGESKAVSFEATPWAARTYQVTVDGLTGSFAARYK